MTRPINSKGRKRHCAAAEEEAKTSGVETLQQQLGDLRTAAAEAQGSLQSRSAVLENQRRNLQSTESRIAHREQLIATLAEDSATVRAAIEALRRREDAVTAEIAALQAKIDPDEAALHDLEHEQAQLGSGRARGASRPTKGRNGLERGTACDATR